MKGTSPKYTISPTYAKTLMTLVCFGYFRYLRGHPRSQDTDRTMHRLLLLAIPAAFLLAGCVRTIAVSTVGGIVSDGFTAFTGEDDLEFAQEALPGNLKLLDVMLKSEPENDRLLLLTAEGYASYALAFLEDTEPERARVFYLRARDYALRMLRREEGFARGLEGTLDEFQKGLATLDDDDVPAAFWAAFGWGGHLYLSLTDLDAIADLPRVEALMKFVAERDSAFYFGGPQVLLGTLYRSRSRILGGNPELAKRYFESALRINGGAFLMTYVYYARSYAVQTLDEALFDELLQKVDRTPTDVLPDYRLANAVAKKKAKLLAEKKAELF